MKTGHRFVLFLILCTAMVASAGCQDNQVLRLQDQTVISFDSMVAEASKSRVIVIGETHDNRAHHDRQLKIIRTLYEGGVPAAVGLEMFRAENQEMLDKWWRWGMPTEQFETLYRENWGLPWPLYRDIFLYARQKRIPLVGLNVPSEAISKVARDGYGSLTEAERRKLPPGITCTLDESYRSFIRKAFTEHAHASGLPFDHFCEAQMVWDTAMAVYALEYLDKNPGSRMVILTGSVHAWKRAIPHQIATMRPDVTVSVILQAPEGKAEQKKLTAEDADFLVLN
ncbi:MAG TPA: ChaN family lipoprotein [Syntrophales bacterium]|nr:ChaN family lipoprotein [Syntrophales bacterium]